MVGLGAKQKHRDGSTGVITPVHSHKTLTSEIPPHQRSADTNPEVFVLYTYAKPASDTGEVPKLWLILY